MASSRRCSNDPSAPCHDCVYHELPLLSHVRSLAPTPRPLALPSPHPFQDPTSPPALPSPHPFQDPTNRRRSRGCWRLLSPHASPRWGRPSPLRSEASSGCCVELLECLLEALGISVTAVSPVLMQYRWAAVSPVLTQYRWAVCSIWRRQPRGAFAEGCHAGAETAPPAASWWRTGGWLEVEGEADVCDPRVSERRKRNIRDVLVHTEDAYAYSSPAVGPSTHKT
ncbi:hypothetical protein PVAP13_2KG166096 [Panicum virgatum]|uniref:Uncharacterized protein n=1 Tax=Panicum virgatum TaxID=38727 RepID=A0A8T0W5K4_PANVG|nr:hypothetical protein PVAP13_2KG166096 [Panicum virgatum]